QKSYHRLDRSGKDGGVRLPPCGIQYRHHRRRLVDVESDILVVAHKGAPPCCKSWLPQSNLTQSGAPFHNAWSAAGAFTSRSGPGEGVTSTGGRQKPLTLKTDPRHACFLNLASSSFLLSFQ